VKRWLILLGLLLLTLSWAAWTEFQPASERDLRIAVQDRLEAWFPDEMAPARGDRGFVRDAAAPSGPVAVVLVHGLDEPGGIWSTLQARLDREGIPHAEFRYPNDQAIDASADDLMRHWPQLAADGPVVLVGHSMGGLVVRDFVSRHRHPVSATPSVTGPAVGGVILIGTPNHGSEWARLRAWLEIREYAADLPAGRFSLFAALRDGTGAAKIDLRPGSDFLARLNARPWPESVPVRIIGGRITEPSALMKDRLSALSRNLDIPALRERIEQLWARTGASIGDGAVPLDSLPLEHAPAPLVLPASHRGLIASMPLSDGPPPAIEPVIGYLQLWEGEADDIGPDPH
jgi:pimeloyl-ACP methyl ester carboxylesterase